MSQNKKDFQSKSRKGGQNFGGKGRGPGRPASRGFSDKFEGDRKKSFGRRGDGEARPPRRDREEFGDRPQRRSFGDKPAGRRFGDKGPRREFGDRPPRREFGDRPPRKEFGDRPPRKEFGDRPARKEFGTSDRPRRSFGDKPAGRKFGDKGPRREFGDRPPRREFGDRPPRKEFSDRPPRKEFGDRPARKEFGASDRPRRSFGDKPFKDKSFGDKAFKDKPFKSGPKKTDRGFQRTYKRYDDDRPQRSEPASFETRNKLKSDRANYGAPSSAFLYGIHAVTEALKNPDRLHQRLLCTQSGFESIEKVYNKADEEGLKMPEITFVEKEDLERLLPRDAVHQDVLLDCQPLQEVFLKDVLNAAPDDAKIVVLDQVTDPHNIGAILRSAAAFGTLAIVMQKVNAPDVTGTMAKAASGAVEHVPIVREVNLSRALEQLKEAGFFCIGLAERGKQTLADLKLKGKTALVLGAEGDGLRRLVAENCDELVRLPTQGDIGSLNVSNAAAVALYELAR